MRAGQGRTFAGAVVVGRAADAWAVNPFAVTPPGAADHLAHHLAPLAPARLARAARVLHRRPLMDPHPVHLAVWGKRPSGGIP